MMHYALRYWWCIAIGLAIGLCQNWDWVVQTLPVESVSVSWDEAAMGVLVSMYLLVVVKNLWILWKLQSYGR